MPLLWPFSPNLRSANYTVHREYRTDLILSRIGREQRRALRQTPRKRVEFLQSQSGDCLRDLNNLMVTAQSLQLAIADRPRFTILSAGIGGGSDSTFVDPLPSWIVVGAELVLVDKARQAIRTVNMVVAVSGGGWTVTFDESEAVAWPVGTRLNASLNGYLGDNLFSTRTSPRGVLETRIVYHVDPGVEATEDVGAATATFNGRELWLTEPVRWIPVSKRFLQGGAADVDYGFGRIQRFFPIPFATRTWRAVYSGCDFPTSEIFRQLFDRQKGRRGEFFMPTFNADLVPTAALTTAGMTMIVDGSDIATIYDANTVYQALAVRLKTGTWLARKIASIVAGSGDVSTITLLSAWGEDVALNEIDKVCWLPMWRFSTDILTTVWHRENLATVSMGLQTLEYFPTDVGSGAIRFSIGMSGGANALPEGAQGGFATASFDVGMSGDAGLLAAASADAALNINMVGNASGNSPATATASISIGMSGGSTDPDFSSVSFLSGFEGADEATTFDDEGPGDHTITAVADAQVDTGQKKFGDSSVEFDGAGDGLLCDNHADFLFGSGEFTIELFFRMRSNVNTFLVAMYDTNSQQSWAIARENDGDIGLIISTTGSNAINSPKATGQTTSNDIWYHLAVDKDSGDKYRFYLDGVMKASRTASETLHAGTGKLSIGGHTASGSMAGSYHDGWIDELRITKGVARYASDGGFTVPASAYPRS